MAETHRLTIETEERRAIARPVEYRKTEDGPGTISGYAAVFNEETTIGGGYFGWTEVIAPGAFKAAIKNDDVRALFNHDPNYILGRNTAGTLKLSEDKTGLKYDIDLPDTGAGRDVKTSIQRGDVSGSSFGFVVEEDEWEYPPAKSKDLPKRTITKVMLFDVSPVTYPAYPQTSVTARSKAKAAADAVAAQESTRHLDDAQARASARAAVNRAKAWAT